MLKKDQIIELKIEKLVYGGEGIGKYNGFTVFVPDSAPGDIVRTKVISVKKSYARALIEEIINPSELRVKPFCPLFNVCGGCQWQHISYDEQLNQKQNIILECLQQISSKNIEIKQTLPGEKIKNFRCKVQFPVQQTKVSKRFLAGYYKKSSHELVNIKYCPVQPEILDKITGFLRQKASELGLTAYSENKKNGLIRHFIYRYSETNQDLILTIVINSKTTPEELKKFAVAVKEEYKQISGVAVNFNTTASNIIMGSDSEVLSGKGYIEEILDDKLFRISHDAFFQVNPLTARKMFYFVREVIAQRLKTPDVLDVYAGSGSFSIYLSDLANQITCVESALSSINDGEENFKANNINNISYIRENADTALPALAGDNKKFDVTILDPPRKGCSREVLEAVKQITDKMLIYVSCNPATLARDYKLLSDRFRAEFVQPVDMFCHTYHVESIMVMTRY